MKLFSKEFIRQKKEDLVSDEEKWRYFQNACIFILLGATSFVMSIVNIFTHKGELTWVTLGFSIACALNLLLMLRKGILTNIAMCLFVAELTALLVFFLITGIPDGFSVIWTAMLPSFGLLMFGLINGSIISMILFTALGFFFWTPIGHGLLQYDYNPTFMMRFPLLYLAFFAVAFLLEKVRETVYKALKESREKYEFLCYHDALTGLHNRLWFQSLIEHSDERNIKPSAIAILDIDNFKQINDNYGHLNGDVVMRELGQSIVNTLHGSAELCRWGGDEFLILFHADIDAATVCKRIVNAVRSHEFEFNGKNQYATVSVGLVTAADGSTEDINSLVQKADINLYKAKNEGRNRTITSSL